MSAEDRLAEIRRRAQTATPGPWTARRGYPNLILQGADPEQGLISASLAERPDEDAEFVAAARRDVPWMVDLLDELLRLSPRDWHPEADITQHSDPVSAGFITGMETALKMVRERIANAAKEQP